jgi:hypothetical protein
MTPAWLKAGTSIQFRLKESIRICGIMRTDRAIDFLASAASAITAPGRLTAQPWPFSLTPQILMVSESTRMTRVTTANPAIPAASPDPGSFTQRYVKRHGLARKCAEVRHLRSFSSPHFTYDFRGDILGGDHPAIFWRVLTGTGWRVPKTLELRTTRHQPNDPGKPLILNPAVGL